MAGKRGMSKSKAERAELYFAIYASLGPDRSLRKVVEICNQIGTQWPDLAKAMGVGVSVDIAVAQSTINSYSAEFGWQERIAKLNLTETRVFQRGIEAAMQASQRHVQQGQAMQQLSALAIRAKMTPDPVTGRVTLTADSLSGTEIARLMDVGIKAERSALEAQHQHVNSADTAAQFLHQHLPPIVVEVFDFLRLTGDARALAIGFLSEKVDELIVDLYRQFRVEPPDYLVPSAPAPDNVIAIEAG